MAAGNFPIQVLEKRRQIQTIARLKPYRAAGRDVWHSDRPTSWIKGLVEASIAAETLIRQTEIRTS